MKHISQKSNGQTLANNLGQEVKENVWSLNGNSWTKSFFVKSNKLWPKSIENQECQIISNQHLSKTHANLEEKNSKWL